MKPSRLVAHGFTLVELLVVVAIIGVLIALLIPAVQAARESSRRTQCLNNTKQLALGLITYHDAQKQFPAAHKGKNSNSYSWGAHILPFIEETALFDRLRMSMTRASGNMFNESADVKSAIKTPLATFRCPSDNPPRSFKYPTTSTDEGAVSSYTGNAGGFANSKTGNWLGGFWDRNYYPGNCAAPVTGIMWTDNACKMDDISDGTSKTILVGEVTWQKSQSQFVFAAFHTNHGCGDKAANQVERFGMIPLNADVTTTGTWGSTPNATFDNNEQRYTWLGWHSPHKGGVQFAFADGSTRFINDTIDAGIPDHPSGNFYDSVFHNKVVNNTLGNVPMLSRLASRNDGQPINAD